MLEGQKSNLTHACFVTFGLVHNPNFLPISSIRLVFSEIGNTNTSFYNFNEFRILPSFDKTQHVKENEQKWSSKTC